MDVLNRKAMTFRSLKAFHLQQIETFDFDLSFLLFSYGHVSYLNGTDLLFSFEEFEDGASF